jgi:protein-S-isoprenylcysteine O-methyltransferase Ste14
MRRDCSDYLLVAAQVGAIAGLAAPGAPKWSQPRPARALATAALVAGFGLLAAGGVGLGRELRPFPTPTPSGELRTRGAFAVSRHPMYTGGIAGAAGIAVLRRRAEPLVAFAVLVLVLNVKVRYEERLLRERFAEDYDAYAARVPRLLPRLPM